MNILKTPIEEVLTKAEISFLNISGNKNKNIIIA